MPSYDFWCMPEYNGCDFHFEIVCSMEEIADKKPDCPKCGLQDPVFREWSACRVSSPPMTLGSLADANASKLSDDEKKYLKEKHRTKKEGEPIKPIERTLSEKNG